MFIDYGLIVANRKKVLPMRTAKTFYLLVAAFLLATTATAQNWAISEDYDITFDGSGAAGYFGGLKGTIVFDPENVETASFEVQLDPSTISTGNKTKDRHARGKSWFNVAKYTTVTFTSTQVVKTGNSYELLGTLELHGIKKGIVIPFTFTPKKDVANEAVFEGRFSLNRKDFDILGPIFGFAVGETFTVEVRVPVKK